MANKFTSRLRLTALSLLIIGAAAGFHAYRASSRATAQQRVLADFLLVERLPPSARDVECREFGDTCDPGNSSTICFVRIEPHDFELLASQAQLRKNEDTCPENFSETHQMGVTIGPSFKINEEHWGGTEDAHAAVYPDAAHSQFIAVLSRPSAVRCVSPAITAAIVRRRDAYSPTAEPAAHR